MVNMQNTHCMMLSFRIFYILLPMLHGSVTITISLSIKKVENKMEKKGKLESKINLNKFYLL